MNIYNFTPASALLGGILIGLSAVLLVATNGKIAGISGIVREVLNPSAVKNIDWRFLFLMGLIGGSLFYRWLSGIENSISLEASWFAIIVGGALTGFGTAISGGCTSGHGVCGLARRSLRSFAATMSFMFTGVITVFVLRHML